MDGLRRRLAVGVTYDQYVAEVRGIRSTYGEIPTEKLQIDCLTAVATPARRPSTATSKPPTTGANASPSRLRLGNEIEPVLQRRWRIASHFLSEAEDGLEPPLSGIPTKCAGAAQRRPRPGAKETNARTAAGWDKVRSPKRSPVPGVDSAGRPNQCGA